MGNVIGAWFERDVVRATGPDAAKFLQGQISQDVETLVEAGSAWTLLLDPSGKLTTWMRITRVDGDEFLLDCAAGWSETMLTRLNRFKIRVACDFVLLDGWKDLYMPVLQLVTPRLRKGSVVLADNIYTFKRSLRPFTDYLQSGKNGFQSTTLSISDGFEYAVYEGK